MWTHRSQGVYGLMAEKSYGDSLILRFHGSWSRGICGFIDHLTYIWILGSEQESFKAECGKFLFSFYVHMAFVNLYASPAPSLQKKNLKTNVNAKGKQPAPLSYKRSSSNNKIRKNALQPPSKKRTKATKINTYKYHSPQKIKPNGRENKEDVCIDLHEFLKCVAFVGCFFYSGKNVSALFILHGHGSAAMFFKSCVNFVF